MRKLAASTLLLMFALGATSASAGVYMCVDPATGKKTFTDRACPSSAKPGKKVRVESQTGSARKSHLPDKTWNSERDRSVSGRDNFAEDKRVAYSVSGNGLLGIDS